MTRRPRPGSARSPRASSSCPSSCCRRFPGQLADARDKARIIRIVKFCEILIMVVGAAGLAMAWKGIAVATVAMPLHAPRLVRDGGPLDLLRPDQICDPAAASPARRSARRHRAGRGGNLCRDPRRHSARRNHLGAGGGGGGAGDRPGRLSLRPAGAAGAGARGRPPDRPQRRALVDPAGRRDAAHPAALSSRSSRSASSGRSAPCCSSSSRRW